MMVAIDRNEYMEGLSTFQSKGKLYCVKCGLSVEDIKDEPEMKKVHIDFHKELK